MAFIKVSLQKEYEDIKEEILDKVSRPEELKLLTEKLERLLPEEEFLDAEILLNEAILNIESTRFDFGYSVKKAIDDGLEEYVIEF